MGGPPSGLLTPESVRVVLATAGPVPKAIRTQLVRLQKVNDQAEDEIRRIDSKTAAVLRDEHVAGLADRLMKGEGLTDRDGWGAGEFEAERQSFLAACKAAQRQVRRDALLLVSDLLMKAAEAGVGLVEESIRTTAARRARLGLRPTLDEEAIVLAKAVVHLEEMATSGYASQRPSDLLAMLEPLEAAA